MTEQQPENSPATWPSVPEEQSAPAYPAPPQTSGNAIVALILSIGAWVICPIIPAIVALVFANMAKKEIAAGEGRVTGQGLVTASTIVAWINIGVWAALLVIGLLALVLVAVAGAL
jgi:uncharacterized membrane protein